MESCNNDLITGQQICLSIRTQSLYFVNNFTDVSCYYLNTVKYYRVQNSVPKGKSHKKSRLTCTVHLDMFSIIERSRVIYGYLYLL